MFIYSESQLEEVQEGEVEDELVIIGLEVAEDEGTIATSQFDNSVNYPQPRSTLSAGTKNVVLMPDSGLSRLYGDTRLEVYHDPAEVAKCLLWGNYLPPAVFGRQANADVQQMMFDFLELEHRGVNAEDAYREQLREVAGMDDPEVTEEAETTRAGALKEEYKYTELKSMASDMGIPNANQKKDDLADWIAENEDEE